MLPLTTREELRETEDSSGGAGVTERACVSFCGPYDAEMLAVAFAVTLSVVIENGTEEAPAATATVAGTVAAAVLSLASATEMPPVGAGLLRYSIPVEGVPPLTEDGLR